MGAGGELTEGEEEEESEDGGGEEIVVVVVVGELIAKFSTPCATSYFMN